MKPNHFIRAVVIATILGFSAGVVGQMIADVYFPLTTYRSTEYFSNIPSSSGDDKTGDVVKAAAKGLVGIYPAKGISADPLKQIYLPGDSLGQGLILTADGWVATTKEVISDFDKGYAVISYDGKIFSASQFVADPLIDIVFFKIDAKDLSVLKFSQKGELGLGETLLAIGPGNSADYVSIKNSAYDLIINKKDLVKSSEKLYKFIFFQNGLGAAYRGSPAIDSTGGVVGLVFSRDQKNYNLIVPVSYIQDIMSGVFKKQKASRPWLGVHYLDLTESTGISETLSHSAKAGALLYQDSTASAVSVGSPAKQAGLRAGDIILQVDGVSVDKKNSLAELIGTYSAGDKVQLTILRNGQEMEIEVTLGEVK